MCCRMLISWCTSQRRCIKMWPNVRASRNSPPARALIAELVRRYWVLGLDCSLLEIQKLAYFLERSIEEHQLENPLNLKFSANKFGPYSRRLNHLLNGLD